MILFLVFVDDDFHNLRSAGVHVGVDMNKLPPLEYHDHRAVREILCKRQDPTPPASPGKSFG